MSFPAMLQPLRDCVMEDALNKELLSAERSGPAGKVLVLSLLSRLVAL